MKAFKINNSNFFKNLQNVGLTGKLNYSPFFSNCRSQREQMAGLLLSAYANQKNRFHLVAHGTGRPSHRSLQCGVKGVHTSKIGIIFVESLGIQT